MFACSSFRLSSIKTNARLFCLCEIFHACLIYVLRVRWSRFPTNLPRIASHGEDSAACPPEFSYDDFDEVVCCSLWLFAAREREVEGDWNLACPIHFNRKVCVCVCAFFCVCQQTVDGCTMYEGDVTWQIVASSWRRMPIDLIVFVLWRLSICIPQLTTLVHRPLRRYRVSIGRHLCLNNGL